MQIGKELEIQIVVPKEEPLASPSPQPQEDAETEKEREKEKVEQVQT